MQKKLDVDAIVKTNFFANYCHMTLGLHGDTKSVINGDGFCSSPVILVKK